MIKLRAEMSPIRTRPIFNRVAKPEGEIIVIDTSGLPDQTEAALKLAAEYCMFKNGVGRGFSLTLRNE